MKIALESHEGVRGCRFAVIEIDKATQTFSQVKKIPGISFLNNFFLMMEFGHGKHIRLGKIIFIRIFPLQAIIKEVQ